VVDALDEYPEYHQKLLITELQYLGDAVHLMVTSRPLPLIERLFQGATNLEIRAAHNDMREYVRSQISQSKLEVHVENDQLLQEHIINKVTGNMGGMCVFIVCHS
jgi:hypothetical protein